MSLQESGQMYLETILILTRRQKDIRAIDICEYMGYSKPSISRAVGLLKKGGFITVNGDGFITLTDLGRKEAEKVYERHETLTKYLTYIGVNPKTAAEDACKIEHVISDESFEAIKRHVKAYKE